MKFSDNLSPNNLVAWLSQELTAKGLTLSEEMKDKLIGKLHLMTLDLTHPLNLVLW